jgi:uncharacterized protein
MYVIPRKGAADMLLARGADPNLASDDGTTALMVASAMGDVDLVRDLLDRGMDPNRHDKTGETALISAAGSSSQEAPATLRLLLTRGADLKAKVTKRMWDGDAFTALMWAAALGLTSNIETLLDAGANLHVKTEKGRTALMWAVKQGQVEAVQLLLRRGARVNDEDEIGKTVLNYTEDLQQGQTQTDMIRILKKAGAK